MNSRKTLKNQYKNSPPKRGVYIVRNKLNNKAFVGSSMNVPGRINRFQFELANGMHKNKALQKDFEKYGAGNFSFEIAELLKEEKPNFDYAKALAALEEKWRAKVQPFGENGYNGPGR